MSSPEPSRFQPDRSGVGVGIAVVESDEPQARRWTSGHRWVTLAMLAHVFLAAATAHD